MQKKGIRKTRCSTLDARRNAKSSSKDVPFSSNSIRLSGCEWIIVGIVCAAVLYLGPALWGRLEGFNPAADYRLRSEQCDDYWLYERYCSWACSRYETLVIGDSVIRGPHVSADNTFPHYLNEIAGSDRFANLGVDAMHPVALAGLLRYYGRAISGKNVILHLNPLWMSSKRVDLQGRKEFDFEHAKLVPQFIPRIPCYKDSFSKRMSAAVERHASFLSWTSHLRITYFESKNLPDWTMEHPYKNPLRPASIEPAAEDSDKNDKQQELASWLEKGTAKEDFQWIELETSMQWRYFRRAIELLKARGNTVFVLVGPFNEHMLEPDSLETYCKIKLDIEAWLRDNDVPYYVPEALPSELYRDASHPLRQGYAMLARRLFDNESFKSTILHTPGDPAAAQ